MLSGWATRQGGVYLWGCTDCHVDGPLVPMANYLSLVAHVGPGIVMCGKICAPEPRQLFLRTTSRRWLKIRPPSPDADLRTNPCFSMLETPGGKDARKTGPRGDLTSELQRLPAGPCLHSILLDPPNDKGYLSLPSLPLSLPGSLRFSVYGRLSVDCESTASRPRVDVPW